MDADALFDALIQSKNDAIKLLQSSLQETRAAQTTLLIDKEKQEALIQKLQRDKQEAITAAERGIQETTSRLKQQHDAELQALRASLQKKGAQVSRFKLRTEELEGNVQSQQSQQSLLQDRCEKAQSALVKAKERIARLEQEKQAAVNGQLQEISEQRTLLVQEKASFAERHASLTAQVERAQETLRQERASIEEGVNGRWVEKWKHREQVWKEEARTNQERLLKRVEELQARLQHVEEAHRVALLQEQEKVQSEKTRMEADRQSLLHQHSEQLKAMEEGWRERLETLERQLEVSTLQAREQALRLKGSLSQTHLARQAEQQHLAVERDKATQEAATLRQECHRLQEAMQSSTSLWQTEIETLQKEVTLTRTRSENERNNNVVQLDLLQKEIQQLQAELSKRDAHFVKQDWQDNDTQALRATLEETKREMENLAKSKALALSENTMLKEEAAHLTAMVNRLQRLVSADQSKERRALDEWKKTRQQDKKPESKSKKTKSDEEKDHVVVTRQRLHRHRSLPRMIEPARIEQEHRPAWQIVS